MLAWPGAGCHRVPAHASVGWEGLEHSVLTLNTIGDQVGVGWHHAFANIAIEQVWPHAIGGEEDRLGCQFPE